MNERQPGSSSRRDFLKGAGEFAVNDVPVEQEKDLFIFRENISAIRMHLNNPANFDIRKLKPFKKVSASNGKEYWIIAYEGNLLEDTK